MPTALGTVASGVATSTPVLPVTSGLVGWWDASDASTFTVGAGSSVSQWRDKTATGWHFQEPVPNYQPVRNRTINGRPAVYFDPATTGWSARLSATFQPPAVLKRNDVTLFVACLPGNITSDTTWGSAAPFAITSTGSSGGGWFPQHRSKNTPYMGIGINWTDVYPVDLPTPTAPNITTMTLDAQATPVITIYSNGVAGVPTRTQLPPAVLAGSYSLLGEGWVGSLGEVLFYDRYLNVNERRPIESYLQAKWGTPFTPGMVPGLVGWWDASTLVGANGSSVASWPDLSGAGQTLTGSPSPTLTTGGLNGKNVLQFSGASQAFSAASGAHTEHFFVVAKYDLATFNTYAGLLSAANSGDVDSGIVLVGADGGANWYTTGSHTSYVYHYNGVLDPAAPYPAPMQAWASLSVSASPTTWIDPFILRVGIDRNHSRYWTGSVAEVIAYNRTLSTTERQTIESYLKSKWATP